MTQVRVGFIGLGFIAQTVHLPCFNSLSDVKIAAVCDASKNLSEEIARQYDVTQVFTDSDDFLANADIDCVVLTVGRTHTPDLVLEILNAGYPLLTEKPISLDPEKAHQILQLSKNKSIPVFVGYMKVYDPKYLELKRIIADLSVGSLQLIRMYCHMGESYCRPLGHTKSPTQIPKISPQSTFEASINTFSHITFVAQDLFSSPIIVHNKLLDRERTSGIILGKIKDVPLSVELAQISSLPWSEGIELLTTNKRINLTFPPALLRGAEAELIVTSTNETYTTKSLCTWKWPFREQAIFFIKNYNKNNPYVYKMLENACSQVTLFSGLYE